MYLLILLLGTLSTTSNAATAAFSSSKGPVYKANTIRSATNRLTTTQIASTQDGANDESVIKPTVIVAGATGYIGRAVVQESVRQGYHTVALVRDANKVLYGDQQSSFQQYFDGAKVVQCDVTDPQQLETRFQEIAATCPVTSSHGGTKKDVVIVSCLASRSGVKRDAYKIDYEASLNCLHAGQAIKAKQYVLLSAFCVAKPKLYFQRAKLKLERAIVEQQRESTEGMTYSIVRPTAFYKSLSGKLDNLLNETPYVLFGNGELTRCNPIAERDLADFMLGCIHDKERQNQILNVGGPDEPTTNKQQALLLSEIVQKEPKFVYIPTGILDFLVNTFQWLGTITNSEKLQNGAEIARIIKYYAEEDMLTTKPNEIYGSMTLRQHFEKIVAEGQEYDPYVAIYTRGGKSSQVPSPPIQSDPSSPTSTTTSAAKQATIKV